MKHVVLFVVGFFSGVFGEFWCFFSKATFGLTSNFIHLFYPYVFSIWKIFIVFCFDLKKIYFPRIQRKSWAGKSRAHVTLEGKAPPQNRKFPLLKTYWWRFCSGVSSPALEKVWRILVWDFPGFSIICCNKLANAVGYCEGFWAIV